MNRAISHKEFKKEVTGNTGLTLVQFTIDWNGSCQIMAPVFEELAKSYKAQASFFTVDLEKEKKLGEEHGIIEIPTILFFRNGEIIDHAKGLIPKNKLIMKIENALASDHNKPIIHF